MSVIGLSVKDWRPNARTLGQSTIARSAPSLSSPAPLARRCAVLTDFLSLSAGLSRWYHIPGENLDCARGLLVYRTSLLSGIEASVD